MSHGSIALEENEPSYQDRTSAEVKILEDKAFKQCSAQELMVSFWEELQRKDVIAFKHWKINEI
jgi:hypothetical protein